MTVDASGINFNAYCWVKNSDWLSVRSDLTLKILKEFETNQRISMSRSQQEVFILDKNRGRGEDHIFEVKRGQYRTALT